MQKVTIITIYVNKKNIENMVDSLPKGDYGLHVVENMDNPVSFAEANNLAAKDVTTPYILFLNDDIITKDDFLTPMLNEMTEQVGIVGAKLLYPDGSIQHDGIKPIRDVTDNLRINFNYFKKNSDKKRNCIVTGACLLIKTSLFNELGGFDETFINGFEDIDLCIRAYNLGYDYVYQPKAVLTHLECQSRGKKDTYRLDNLKYLRSKYGL